jgi:glutathione S-transferase
MRARLALEAGGIEVELREIFFRDKAPEFLATSPKGTVPVLVGNDGFLLEESLDIISWAMDTSRAGEVLEPDAASTVKAVALIERMDADFKPHLDHYKYASRYEDIDGNEARSKASDFLNELDGMLAGQPYLFGYKRSVADIGVAPFVRQFAHVDQDWFYAQSWENLIDWLDVFKASPEFQRIMHKYPKWVAGDDVILFPPILV